MIHCTICQHQEYEGTLFCSECGSQLWEVAARPPGDKSSSPSTQRFAADELTVEAMSDLAADAGAMTGAGGLPIVIRVPGTGHPISLTGQDEYSLGRGDPKQGHIPDLDLGPYRALELGVSRLHAVLQVSGHGLTLTDLGSTNGTLVNGVRLAPHAPQPLRDGDELRLGKLALRVFF